MTRERNKRICREISNLNCYLKFFNRTTKVNDLALLYLESNPEMQSRIQDDADPHVAKPVKLADKVIQLCASKMQYMT